MKDVINSLFGPQGLILIGGALSVIGAFWSAKRDFNSEKELNEKNEIIIEKTQEIANLNDKIVNILTGGNSFPKVILSSSDRLHGTPTLSLMGDNVIQNVTGRFIDVRELRNEQKQGIFNYDHGLYFEKKIISPAYVQFLDNKRTMFDFSKGGRYMIHFYTPYNTFTELLAVEIDKDTGLPLQAYKIFEKSINEEPIHVSYPDNFPIPLDEIDFLENIPDEEEIK